MAFDLTEYSEGINQALGEGRPCVLATVDEDGTPNIGFKGSMMVFDKDHLAYWERTQRTHLKNLRQSQKVAVLYYNPDRKMYMRFQGEATLYDEGPMRQDIMRRTIAPELERDPERKGVGVLIRIDAVTEIGRGLTHRQED